MGGREARGRGEDSRGGAGTVPICRYMEYMQAKNIICISMHAQEGPFEVPTNSPPPCVGPDTSGIIAELEDGKKQSCFLLPRPTSA